MSENYDEELDIVSDSDEELISDNIDNNFDENADLIDDERVLKIFLLDIWRAVAQ